MIVSSVEARPIAVSESSHRRLHDGTTRTEFRGGSGDGGKTATGSGRNGFPIWTRTIARTHIALTSSRPGHTGVSPLCTHDGGPAPDGDAPPSSELRHCTAYPVLHPEATWAQPLGREELS